jgi:hypothetical protein
MVEHQLTPPERERRASLGHTQIIDASIQVSKPTVQSRGGLEGEARRWRHVQCHLCCSAW